ncbi:hypothetical protein [Kitasatospora sp. NPDC093806]|uniref:hypothetical protein n=1 Tax=Kitasatospora sp. NPDC093806 TaxID=3155075 RepID=UPI00341E273A
MSQEDREPGAEELGALFRAVLDQPEPTVPPVGPQVKRAGGRLRRRRRLLTATAVAAAVAVIATAGVAVSGRPLEVDNLDATVPAAPAPSAPTPAAATATPDRPATDWQQDAAGHAALLRFLREHPLPGVTAVDERDRATEFTLRRTSGGPVRFARFFEGPVRDSSLRESPCEQRKLPNGDVAADPIGTGCLPVPLPDGALAWVLNPLTRGQPQSVLVWLVTAQGRLFTLGVDSGPVDGRYDVVPLEAVRDLVATPGFVRAVDEGWRDSAIR